jgi:hypothetical protein
MDFMLLAQSLLTLTIKLKDLYKELNLATTDFDSEIAKLQMLIDTINKNDEEWRKNHPV